MAFASRGGGGGGGGGDKPPLRRRTTPAGAVKDDFDETVDVDEDFARLRRRDDAGKGLAELLAEEALRPADLRRVCDEYAAEGAWEWRRTEQNARVNALVEGAPAAAARRAAGGLAFHDPPKPRGRDVCEWRGRDADGNVWWCNNAGAAPRGGPPGAPRLPRCPYHATHCLAAHAPGGAGGGAVPLDAPNEAGLCVAHYTAEHGTPPVPAPSPFYVPGVVFARPATPSHPLAPHHRPHDFRPDLRRRQRAHLPPPSGALDDGDGDVDAAAAKDGGSGGGPALRLARALAAQRRKVAAAYRHLIGADRLSPVAAAVRIQSAHRMWLAQRAAARLRREAAVARRAAAAVTVQRATRGHVTRTWLRRRLLLMDRAARVLQRWWRAQWRAACARRQARLRAAARTIQRFWRARLLSLNARLLALRSGARTAGMLREEALFTIRGMLRRVMFRARLRGGFAGAARRRTAATALQAAARMWAARAAAAALRAQRNRETAVVPRLVALQVQFRRWQARLAARDARHRLLEAAATINRAARGWAGRRRARAVAAAREEARRRRAAARRDAAREEAPPGPPDYARMFGLDLSGLVKRTKYTAVSDGLAKEAREVADVVDAVAAALRTADPGRLGRLPVRAFCRALAAGGVRHTLRQARVLAALFPCGVGGCVNTRSYLAFARRQRRRCALHSLVVCPACTRPGGCTAAGCGCGRYTRPPLEAAAHELTAALHAQLCGCGHHLTRHWPVADQAASIAASASSADAFAGGALAAAVRRNSAVSLAADAVGGGAGGDGWDGSGSVVSGSRRRRPSVGLLTDGSVGSGGHSATTGGGGGGRRRSRHSLSPPLPPPSSLADQQTRRGSVTGSNYGGAGAAGGSALASVLSAASATSRRGSLTPSRAKLRRGSLEHAARYVPPGTQLDLETADAEARAKAEEDELLSRELRAKRAAAAALPIGAGPLQPTVTVRSFGGGAMGVAEPVHPSVLQVLDSLWDEEALHAKREEVAARLAGRPGPADAARRHRRRSGADDGTSDGDGGGLTVGPDGSLLTAADREARALLASLDDRARLLPLDSVKQANASLAALVGTAAANAAAGNAVAAASVRQAMLDAYAQADAAQAAYDHGLTGGGNSDSKAAAIAEVVSRASGVGITRAAVTRRRDSLPLAQQVHSLEDDSRFGRTGADGHPAPMPATSASVAALQRLSQDLVAAAVPAAAAAEYHGGFDDTRAETMLPFTGVDAGSDSSTVATLSPAPSSLSDACGSVAGGLFRALLPPPPQEQQGLRLLEDAAPLSLATEAASQQQSLSLLRRVSFSGSATGSSGVRPRGSVVDTVASQLRSTTRSVLVTPAQRQLAADCKRYVYLLAAFAGPALAGGAAASVMSGDGDGDGDDADAGGASNELAGLDVLADPNRVVSLTCANAAFLRQHWVALVENVRTGVVAGGPPGLSPAQRAALGAALTADAGRARLLETLLMGLGFMRPPPHATAAAAATAASTGGSGGGARPGAAASRSPYGRLRAGGSGGSGATPASATTAASVLPGRRTGGAVRGFPATCLQQDSVCDATGGARGSAAGTAAQRRVGFAGGDGHTRLSSADIDDDGDAAETSSDAGFREFDMTQYAFHHTGPRSAKPLVCQVPACGAAFASRDAAVAHATGHRRAPGLRTVRPADAQLAAVWRRDLGLREWEVPRGGGCGAQRR